MAPSRNPNSLHAATPVPRESLALRTAAQLEEELRRGTWHRFLPGERELASLLQVSRMTLRDALARLEEEGLVTSGRGRRRMILSPPPSTAAEEKEAASSRKEVVLLTPIPLQEMEFHLLTLIHLLTHSLSQHGIRLTVTVRASCYSQRPEKTLAQLAGELAPDGWILFRVTEPMQHWFHQHAQPTVIIGNTFGSDTPTFMSQHEAVSRHAAAQFRRLGHRHIAILLPQYKGTAATDRAIREGFSQAAPDLPITFYPHDRSRDGILRTLGRTLLHRDITGILSVGGQYSLLILTHLLERGLRLPADLSLLIWGSDPSFQYLSPEPAYYDYPVARSAQALLRLVLRVLIHGENTRHFIRLLPDLKPGATLGPAPTATRLPLPSALV